MSARVTCEAALCWLGGRQLLRDARAEATWYVNLYYPWDGAGTVPPTRALAWLAVLQQRRRHARGHAR